MIANFAPGLWTPGTPRIPVSLDEIVAKGVIYINLNCDIPEKLFKYFASESKSVMYKVPEIAEDQSHFLHEKLNEYISTFKDEDLTKIIGNEKYRWLIRDYKGPKLDYKLRISLLIELLQNKITKERYKKLKLQSEDKETQPYNHEALKDIEYDSDFLVNLKEFERGFGPLVKNQFAFGVVPPVPSINSAFWFMKMLRQPKLTEKTKVRLDPFLVRKKEEYTFMEYRAWWYGKDFDWSRINNLKEIDHRRAGYDKSNYRKFKYTDLVWFPRGKEIHFICEELINKDNVENQGSRYFHAIYLPKSEKFIHMDGALRFYDKKEWLERSKAHVRNIGKIGTRVKIFKVDGEVDKNDFIKLVPAYFVWNKDIASYFNM